MKTQKLSNKILAILFIIIIFLALYIAIIDNSVSIKINNVYIGEVGNKQAPSKISFDKYNSCHSFIIKIFFNKNVSIKGVYITTPKFTVFYWEYSYNFTLLKGYSQQGFIGSAVSSKYYILAVYVNTPLNKFNGNLSLHIVFHVPETLIY
ncbi:hypothetical protein [Picrophilus oshimae]|uniref:hypothetical protein n=1 Tax=Picrophilus oshimae TaxID=46632 RepID=UPI00064F1419|nr:hypothetical protein [Picrophilus oshimae]